MKPWYKYLPLEYATGLVENGVLRLGTLSDYQDEDEYGKDIGDEGEGSISEWSRVNHTNAKQSDLNRIEKQAIRIVDGVEGVEFRDCLASVTQKSSDLYVFSSSTVFHVGLMKRISKDYHETYDACVRIKQPETFLRAISAVFEKTGKFEGARPCCYMSRTKHYSKSAPHPVFIKEPRYHYQEEVRSVWSPVVEGNINSEILEVPKIVDYCELFFVGTGESTDGGWSKVSEKNFEADVVKIDSSAYSKCRFHNTEIIYCGEGAVSFDDCEFADCSWTFRDAAERTLAFMKSLYRGGDGGEKIIESTFENIRRKD